MCDDVIINFELQDAIDRVNEKSTSRPGKVQKWTILPK